MNNISYVLFEGYEKPSSRYATKRAQEIRQREKNAKTLFKKIDDLLKNPEDLTEEELDRLKKRHASLKRKFKAKKKKVDKDCLLIPFRLDHRTVIYVREHKCFSDKMLSRFSKEIIESVISEYKLQLYKKPDNVVYWNPFY